MGAGEFPGPPVRRLTGRRDAGKLFMFLEEGLRSPCGQKLRPQTLDLAGRNPSGAALNRRAEEDVQWTWRQFRHLLAASNQENPFDAFRRLRILCESFDLERAVTMLWTRKDDAAAPFPAASNY
jgi:hypothetical protein